MADYICSSSYFVASLQIESFIALLYGINGKEALTGDWEELNKETYLCDAFLENNFKLQDLLLHANIN